MRTGKTAGGSVEESRTMEHVAAVAITGGDPLSMETLRWGLARLGPVAERNPVAIGREFIDTMLRMYDMNHTGRRPHNVNITICYGEACSPSAPCSHDFGAGPVRHEPLSGLWTFAGTAYVSRIEAERIARREGLLAQLARDLGLSEDSRERSANA